MVNLCKEIYTKHQLDTVFTNRQYRMALFELVVVPKELATVVEVELDDGFVLAKYENTIKIDHRFGEAYLVKKIEEQRPDIICAIDSTTIDTVPLQTIVRVLNIPPAPYKATTDICYSCSS